MNQTQIKTELRDELDLVEKSLAELGPRSNSGEWEVAAPDMDTSATEPDELADRAEEIEERQGELPELSARREELLRALGAIEAGTYGTCSVCGAAIEAARLEANLAATTCSVHS